MALNGWKKMAPDSTAEAAWLPPHISVPAQPVDDEALRKHENLSRARTQAEAWQVEPGELLRTLIENEIIPRLLYQCGIGADAEMVSEFIGLLQEPDPDSAIRMVEDAASAGATIETLLLDLLAPAARQLGAMWSDDRTDFVTVTTAGFHLQQVLRHLGPDFRRAAGRLPHGGRALLADCPGAQHTFGVMMLAEFFRRDGWQVKHHSVRRVAELSALVRRGWFSLAGLSVGCDDHIEVARQCVAAMRRHARNSAMLIMVGGPAINQRPELVGEIGADFTAADGRQAVMIARLRLHAAQSAG
jgi:methanogenic corrinoid protein MtbC1